MDKINAVKTCVFDVECKGDKLKNNQSIYITAVLIIIGTIIATSLGLFYKDNGAVREFVNQYGDVVKINGSGLYKNDSQFMAAIAQGTDFTFLFVGVPLFVIILFYDIKKQTYKFRLLLLSIISVFAYYAASICFGTTYNFLQLLYILIFSLSFFGLILCFRSIDEESLKEKVDPKFLNRGLIIFLVISGLSLFIAWLPDIFTSLIKRRSLELIEIYTTQITYVLDMGIISPVIFIGLYSLKNRKGIGYIILGIVLMACCIIGVSVSAGTVFQYAVGIELPLVALITKAGIFIILAAVALGYSIRFYKHINE